MVGDLHHDRVTVSDSDEALDFYRDALGLEKSERPSRGPRPRGGPDPDGNVVELLKK